MKIIPLTRNPQTYSCLPYLVLGSWNRLEDINTLVDVGADEYILGHISQINTGVGKRPVDRVILTHNHFDHAGGLAALKAALRPEVLAWSPGPGVDRLLQDGEEILFGDRIFEVIHAPQHSHDSVYLYCREDRVLFAGDSPIRIMTEEGSYLEEFVKVMGRLAGLPVRAIFSGHDSPITEGVEALLQHSLRMVRKGTIIANGHH